MAVKKQWYDIIAPKVFDEKKLGEALSADSKNLVGRTVSVSLADITGDYSKFYIKLKFQIERIDDKVHAKFIGHECMHERIYRMVHRYMRRVDCVQDVVTKDNQKIRIKTIFILIKRVNTSIKSSARNVTKKLLEKAAREKTSDDFMKAVISGELQSNIKKEISKIYPVGNIEIRKSEFLGKAEKKPEELKKEKRPESKKSENKKEVKKSENKAEKDTKEPKTEKESKENV